jgi:ribose transport system substrate-binding protein
MAKALSGKGEVGLIYHGADFPVTRQRYEGFKAIIAKYPGIKIVAEQGIAGPDFTGDAEKAASAILTSHPKVNGLWAVWDVPAEGVLSAARAAGRDRPVWRSQPVIWVQTSRSTWRRTDS